MIDKDFIENITIYWELSSHLITTNSSRAPLFKYQ